MSGKSWGFAGLGVEVSLRDVVAGSGLQGLLGSSGAGASGFPGSVSCSCSSWNLAWCCGQPGRCSLFPVSPATGSSCCEHYFFQAMLLPQGVSGRGEGNSQGQVCLGQSLERGKYTRLAARRGFPLRLPNFSGEMGSREKENGERFQFPAFFSNGAGRSPNLDCCCQNLPFPWRERPQN